MFVALSEEARLNGGDQIEAETRQISYRKQKQLYFEYIFDGFPISPQVSKRPPS